MRKLRALRDDYLANLPSGLPRFRSLYLTLPKCSHAIPRVGLFGNPSWVSKPAAARASSGGHRPEIGCGPGDLFRLQAREAGPTWDAELNGFTALLQLATDPFIIEAGNLTETMADNMPVSLMVIREATIRKQLGPQTALSDIG